MLETLATILVSNLPMLITNQIIFQSYVISYSTNPVKTVGIRIVVQNIALKHVEVGQHVPSQLESNHQQPMDYQSTTSRVIH